MMLFLITMCVVFVCFSSGGVVIAMHYTIQAKRFQPSIIFFDEIDGLAPVRSVKQDQIHASIVSTLLALMDGLDSRGQVVVIGATNRPDAIDSALRRPGRFDRELVFPLPDVAAREAILDIHTLKWSPPLAADIKRWIVDSSVGYCGADLKALCSEAALVSLRRSYPQVYTSNKRLVLDASKLVIRRGDFAAAMSKIVPSSKRSQQCHAYPLSSVTYPLLRDTLEGVVTKLRQIFPCASKLFSEDVNKDINYADQDWVASLTDVQNEDVMRCLLSDQSGVDAMSASATASQSYYQYDSLLSTSLWDDASITHCKDLYIQ